MNVGLMGGMTQLVGETLTSLYPILVKTSNLTIEVQVFIRVFVYTMIPIFFINFTSLWKQIPFHHWIMMGIITFTHIWSSYKGFQLLEAGLSMTLFYTYPILILLMYRVVYGKFIPTYKYFLFFIPLLLVYQLFHEHQVEAKSQSQTFDQQIDNGLYWKGIVFVGLASLTEALTYMYLKVFQTELAIVGGSWNSVFFAYAGSLILSFFSLFRSTGLAHVTLPQLSYLTVANALIGIVGLWCRFFAIPRVSPTVFSALSFMGIISSNLFGHFFLSESLGIKKIGYLLGIVTSLIVIKVL